MVAAPYGYDTTSPARRMRGWAIAVAVHLVLGWLLVSGTAQKAVAVLKKPMVAVVIQEVIIPPLVPPEAPKPPPKEPPKAQPIEPPRAAPVVNQPDSPALNAPPAAERPVTAVVREASPAAISAPAPVPAPPPAPVENPRTLVASLEGEYAGKLRAMLNATKRYPTGRQASQQRPQGRVKVWFTLSRQGALLDVGVLESSSANLLDDAAVATVRRGAYPPFPANTWLGEEQRRFHAELDFTPPSS